MKHGLTLFTALIIAISEAVCRPMPATEVAPPTPRTTALLPSPSLASYLEPPLTPGVLSAPTPVSPVTKAYQHLVEVMDKYHQSFDVYTDAGSGGNHFVHVAKVGTDVAVHHSLPNGAMTKALISMMTGIYLGLKERRRWW